MTLEENVKASYEINQQLDQLITTFDLDVHEVHSNYLRNYAQIVNVKATINNVLGKEAEAEQGLACCYEALERTVNDYESVYKRNKMKIDTVLTLDELAVQGINVAGKTGAKIKFREENYMFEDKTNMYVATYQPKTDDFMLRKIIPYKSNIKR